jgi:beta-glucosidase
MIYHARSDLAEERLCNQDEEEIGMKKMKWMVLGLLLIFVLTGCAAKEKEPQGTDVTTGKEQAGNSGNESKKDKPGRKEQNALQGTTEEKVETLLNSMTLEEKVGQMIQAEHNAASSYEIEEFGLGSILSGGGSYPGNNKIADWDRMITGIQDAAMNTEHQIPVLYGIDAVHGLALVKGAIVFPHNIGLGAANDPELMYQMGAAVAEEMKLIKVPWNFSPCVAVNTDPRWGRTYECYSSDPAIVAKLSAAYVKGQADHGVAATAKHYVADGGATFGTGEGSYLIDRGDAILSEEKLRETHLLPYKELVNSGIQIIMASFSSYNGVKMHENEYLLTEVLKKEYGFSGFIVSDWEAVSGLSGESFEANVVLAVNAGVDMLMEPYRYGEAYNAIIDAVDQGDITEERINDAVGRILTVKINLGLFEDPYMEKVSHEITELGSEGYRDLAKQLVEKSLVLLKNENNTLPLKQGQKLLVIGPAANDIGLQCGGWGLTWQGVMDQGSSKTTEGTTILEGLEEYAGTYGYEIITDQSRAAEADAVILAVGEIPYAEYNGDTEDLSITGIRAHKDNAAAIELAKQLNKPVIALVVAGRNVLINDLIKDCDSMVMCYLPGTEGDGIASVLSGETTFTGKLPMPYYKSTEDIGKDGAELLFDLGYGLTY